MGVQRSSPDPQTNIISYDQFYQSMHSPSKVANNIYQSRLSNSLGTNKSVLHKTISFTETTQSINQYLTILKNIGNKVECSNLYLPVLCQVKDSNRMCSQYQKIELFYENYNINIKNQISARRNIKEKFSQAQIWYILYSTVNALRMFEQFAMNSGNLKTDQILLNDNGHLKVINMLSWPDSTQDLNEHNNHGLKKFYSPQELRAMREKIDKKINYSIAQTFSLGIIILQLATFYNGDSFYDMNRMILNDRALQQADQIMFNNYSRLLYNLVKTMLSGIYDRPLPSQIYTVFEPFQQMILSLQPFEFRQTKNTNMYVSNASLMSL